MQASDLYVNDFFFAVGADPAVLQIAHDALFMKYVTALETYQSALEVLEADRAGGNLVQVLQEAFWCWFADD
jgi:hypothetical protein